MNVLNRVGGGTGTGASVFAYGKRITTGLTCTATKGSKTRYGTFKTIGESEFKYIKWNITKKRDATASWDFYLQVAEFKFVDTNGNPFVWNVNSITSNMEPTSSSETVDKLIDGNVSTKYATGDWGTSQTNNCSIVIELNNVIDLSVYNKYQYYTANDRYQRDPISWEVSVSNNGTDWKTIDTRTNETITTTRNALAGTWSITSPRISGYEITNIDEYGTWNLSCNGYDTTSVLVDTATNYLIEMELQQILYLYNEGNECTDLTGGWSKENYSYAGYTNGGTLNKNADNMTLVRENAYYIPTFGTNNLIDFTGYKYLKVIGNMQGSVSTVFSTFFASPSKSILDSQISSSKVEITTSQEYSIDISALAQCYVGFGANNNLGTLTVSKVWLEREVV